MTDASPSPLTRRLIISPVLLKGEGERFDTRESYMGRLHSMLEYDPVPSRRGDIHVVNLEYPFVESEDFWGGNGIGLTIPGQFSAADLFEGLNRHCRDNPKFIVHEPETGETIGKPEKPSAVVIPFPGKRQP